ncbi:hypothetical protein [Planctomonas psychrotolerans]|uniref:hypothetical protein n=1 Tax=Planctomonas psychrotolerans TaxID=2528712 RepID=UPI00123B0B05|nr:hypothetical protein [Planctomonas psychrotolerans]
MLEDVIRVWADFSLASSTATAVQPERDGCRFCSESPFAAHPAIPQDAPHAAVHPLLVDLGEAREEALCGARLRVHEQTYGPRHASGPFGVPSFVDYGEREDDIIVAVDLALWNDLNRHSDAIGAAVRRFVDNRLMELEIEVGMSVNRPDPGQDTLW